MDAPAVVLRSGVERERATDARLAAGFVNVTVQCEQGLVLLEYLADGAAADRDLARRTVLVDDRQVRVDLAGRVQTGVVGRHMQVEDRARRRLDLLCEKPDALVQRVLVEFARAVPRRRVRVRARDHLVLAEPYEAVLAGHDVAGGLDRGVAAPRVVVAGHHVDVDPVLAHALVGELDPAAQLRDHHLVEEPLLQRRVIRGGGDLLRAGEPRVHAVVADRVEQLVELARRAAAAHLAEERRAERARPVALDRHDRLAGEIASHDQRVDAVEASGAQELPPALVGAVHVRGVVEGERSLRRCRVPAATSLAEESHRAPEGTQTIGDDRTRGRSRLSSPADAGQAPAPAVLRRSLEASSAAASRRPSASASRKRLIVSATAATSGVSGTSPITERTSPASTLAGNGSGDPSQPIRPAASGHTSTIASTSSAIAQLVPRR